MASRFLHSNIIVDDFLDEGNWWEFLEDFDEGLSKEDLAFFNFSCALLSHFVFLSSLIILHFWCCASKNRAILVLV